MILLRITSFDEFKKPLFGKYFEYNNDWCQYVLAVELLEKPNIWKLIDKIEVDKFVADSITIVPGVGKYEHFIGVVIEKHKEKF